MIDADLSHHVRDALQSGQSREDIRKELAAAGWTQPEIDTALQRWMQGAQAAPVPRPIRSTAARDALFYALLFVVFGMVAGNTLALLFGQINVWMPEPDEANAYRRMSGLRWAMAALFVFVPVFWLLDRADDRAVRSDLSRKHMTVRRWLSAIAMLAAVITLLGDALFLIYSWLDGQITSRFLLKSATVAVMALIVLGYFREDRGLFLPAAWGLVGLAIVSLGLSLWTIGGPAQGQMEQRDRWRLSDLRAMTRDVADCAAVSPSLPEALDPMSCARNPARLTGYSDTITYERLSVSTFQLCTEVEFPAAIHTFDLTVSENTVCRRGKVD